jgi:K+-transporting ATPase ATPase C chain
MVKKSILLLIWMSIITGIVYPLLVTLIVQLVAPYKANGSFIYLNERKIGSHLIGQQFTLEKYFWGRPSAVNYDALNSGGSNLGPISVELKKLVAERKENLLKANNIIGETVIPSDLLYASGSGLDPHISVEAAMLQYERVVKARGWDESGKLKIKMLIKSLSKNDKFNSLGMPYINVLELNLALEEL